MTRNFNSQNETPRYIREDLIDQVSRLVKGLRREESRLFSLTGSKLTNLDLIELFRSTADLLEATEDGQEAFFSKGNLMEDLDMAIKNF